jgi:integrase
MGIMFTPQQIRGLKASDKRQEYRDAKGDNLYVVVQPKTGEVSFVIRTVIEGKQRRITLGHFPEMKLADARERSTEMKIALRKGETAGIPLRSRTVATEAPTGITVAEAWDLYWQHEASSRRSSPEKKRIFERDVKPEIGTKPLNQVTRYDLAKLVSTKFQIAKTASNRLHSLLARFFKWCFTHGQALTGLEANPMASVPKMHSERDSARKRYLTKEELGWWFASLKSAGEHRNIHELLMRTLCRFSDILELTWGEVVKRDNGDTALEIGRTKNNEPHVVYLHPSAFELLPKRPRDAKPDHRVFNSGSRSGKPVQRLRVAMEKLAAKRGRQIPHWQPHDYRRTGTTHLAGMTDQDDNPLVQDHILDRLLAHKEQRTIRHYNVYGYYKEKKSALKLWNDFLNSILRSTG